MAQQMDITAEFRPVLLWLSRHFNPQRFFVLLGLVLFLVAWNRGIALLYGMVSLLVAIFAVSYLLPAMNIRKLKVSPPKRAHCHAGDTLELDLRLFSRSRCQHISVTLHDGPADRIAQPAFAPCVNGETGAVLRLPCTRRGEYLVDRLAVSSSFPFGLHTASRTIDCPRSRLLVYPKTFRIDALPIFAARSHSIHGQQAINLPHCDQDYAGVREYRHGDNLKRIHWAASARHQALIVREYESFDRPAMLIILNCNADDEAGTAPDSCFEYSIEIAASLMVFASRHGIAVELFAEGRQGFHLSLSAGDSLNDNHLAQFARMKPDGHGDYWQQVTSLCSRFHHIDTVATFRPLQASGTPLPNKNHIDIRFDRDSFAHRRLKPAPSPAVITDKRMTVPVHLGCRLDGLFDEAR